MSEQSNERRDFGHVYRRARSPYWWVRYELDGRRYFESSHSAKKEEAEKLLERRRTEMGHQVFVEPRARRTTFEDLAAMLEDDYALNRRRSADAMRRRVKPLRRYFGRMRATAITADRITKYVRCRLEEGASAATARYELAMLRRAFRLAYRAGGVAKVPPFPTINVSNARKGFFEEAMLRRLLPELPEHLRPLVEIGYVTGWRKNELLSRRWEHVSFEGEGWIRLEPGESKNDDGRAFPLTNPRLRAALERQRAYTEDVQRRLGKVVPWVFHREGKPVRNFYGAWRSACVAAGLGTWVTENDGTERESYVGPIFHDLRRTAVRNLERAGIPRSVAMALTGHRTEEVYRRYAIAAERDLVDAARKLQAVYDADERAPASGTTILPLRGEGDTRETLAAEGAG